MTLNFFGMMIILINNNKQKYLVLLTLETLINIEWWILNKYTLFCIDYTDTETQIPLRSMIDIIHIFFYFSFFVLEELQQMAQSGACWNELVGKHFLVVVYRVQAKPPVPNGVFYEFQFLEGNKFVDFEFYGY